MRPEVCIFNGVMGGGHVEGTLNGYIHTYINIYIYVFTYILLQKKIDIRI